MVLCHSMNADSVAGYHEVVRTLKPDLNNLCQRICLNSLQLTGPGKYKILDASAYS